VVQASLYLGETLRRLNRMDQAKAHLEVALDEAQKAGLVEEQWKALHALGRIAENAGNSAQALDDYRKAISIIESIRAGLRLVALKSDFLADKRDVYDSVIALQLQQSAPSAGEIFQWMERSRARTLLDRVAAQTPVREGTLEQIQSLVPQDTVLVEFWMGNQSSLAVWVTSREAGIVRYTSTDRIRADATLLLAAVQASGDKWKTVSRDLGNQILAGIPLRRHMIIVPDGPLNIPFETLAVPGSEALLIEKSAVSYLPAARFLDVSKPAHQGWGFPWNKQLVAFGDPPVSSSDALAEKEQWQPLPASADEVRGIARILPGRAELHLGADARKGLLFEQRLEGVPFLHFSTHALVDAEAPNHSRILMASDSSRGTDYIFQEDVYNLDLKNVGLVTLSACDTARGKMVRGEGIQAFSQAFLAAGASATLTTAWKVADQPTASFMQQYYYFLARGESRSEALQAVKLQFLHSNSDLSSPRYWAAFVLNGDGWNPTRRVIPWSVVMITLATLLAGVSLILLRSSTRQRLERATTGTTTPAVSSARKPKT
jgi:CHAT domain-containing protein